MAQLLRTSETLTAGRQEHVLNMQNFIDTSNIEGRFEFSEWVRAYGKYLDEQLEVFSKIQFYQVRSNRPSCMLSRSPHSLQTSFWANMRLVASGMGSAYGCLDNALPEID